MRSGKQAGCGCGRGLGLDELMIVNPGSKDETRGSGRFFLGEDGTLYRADGWRHGGSPRPDPGSGNGSRHVRTHELHGYFLGADGTLYEVVG